MKTYKAFFNRNDGLSPLNIEMRGTSAFRATMRTQAGAIAVQPDSEFPGKNAVLTYAARYLTIDPMIFYMAAEDRGATVDMKKGTLTMTADVECALHREYGAVVTLVNERHEDGHRTSLVDLPAKPLYETRLAPGQVKRGLGVGL